MFPRRDSEEFNILLNPNHIGYTYLVWSVPRHFNSIRACSSRQNSRDGGEVRLARAGRRPALRDACSRY